MLHVPLVPLSLGTTSPFLSTSSAHLIASCFAISYVGSLYVSKNGRLSFWSKAGHARSKMGEQRFRDDPVVIKSRLLAVCISTLLSCLTVSWLVWKSGERSTSAALETTLLRLGLGLSGFQSLYPYLVAPALYLGPIYATYLYGDLPFQARWSLRHNLYPVFFTWPGVRNYVFGPLTEELVFRSCVLAVYNLAGSSTKKMVFLSPLSFGLAHIHHAWEMYNRYGCTPDAARRAILTAIFQLAYTTLFGFHCVFLFLRTGSMYPPLFSHVFCNLMGLPDLGNEIHIFPKRKWSLIFIYILGVFGYIYGLYNWTLVDDNLYWNV